MENRQLDIFMAEKVMGWRFIRSFPDNEHVFQDEKTRMITIPHHWNPTESISDAFQVVEKMRTTHFKWFEMAHRPNGFTCNFSGDPKHTEFAETAPLAICLAARKCIEGWL